MINQTTNSEHEILQAVVQGKEIKFKLNELGQPITRIRAEVLINLIIGLTLPEKPENPKAPQIVYKVSNRGVRINGASIQGNLNLTNTRGSYGWSIPPLIFENCYFEGDDEIINSDSITESVAAFEAKFTKISHLSIKNCEVKFIDISHTEFQSGLSINGLKGIDETRICRIFAAGIIVNGFLEISNTSLFINYIAKENADSTNKHGKTMALDLKNSKIFGNLLLQPFFKAEGGVKLTNAKIEGDFWASGSYISEKNNSIALDCQLLQVNGIFSLIPFNNKGENNQENYTKINQTNIVGIVSFLSAKIGYLYLNGAKLEASTSNDSIYFNSAEIGQVDLNSYSYFDKKEKVSKSVPFESRYDCNFTGVKVSKTFNAQNAILKTLIAENIEIGSDLNLTNISAKNLLFNGAEVFGKVKFSGKINQSASFQGAKVHSDFHLGEKDNELVIPQLKRSFVKVILEDAFISGDLKVHPLKIEPFGPKWSKNQPIVRAIKLSFCKGWRFVDTIYNIEEYFNDSSFDKKQFKKQLLATSLLVKKKKRNQEKIKFDYIFLDGTIGSINELINKGNLILESANQVKDYLRFQQAFLWNGNNGPNRIIESKNELFSLIEIPWEVVWASRSSGGVKLKDLFQSKEGENIENDLNKIDEIFDVKFDKEKSSWVVKSFLFKNHALVLGVFEIHKSGLVNLLDFKDILLFKKSISQSITYQKSFRLFFPDNTRKVKWRKLKFFPKAYRRKVFPKPFKQNDYRILRNEDIKIFHEKIKAQNDIPGFISKPFIDLRGLTVRTLEDNLGHNWRDVYLALNGMKYENFGLPVNTNPIKLKKHKWMLGPIWRYLIFIVFIFLVIKAYLWALLALILIIIGIVKIVEIIKYIRENASWQNFLLWLFLERQKTVPRWRSIKSEPWENRLFWIYKQYSQWLPKKGEYKPQPFEQVAKVFRQQGEYNDSINILIQKLKLERKILYPWWRRILLWVWEYCFGFGIKTWVVLRTFMFLYLIGWVSVIIANTGELNLIHTEEFTLTPIKINKPVLILDVTSLTSVAITENDSIVTANEAGILTSGGSFVKEIPCGTQIEPSLYALDIFVPLLDLRQETKCTVSEDNNALIWRLGKAIYAILGWIVTSALILTLTGFVKREVER